MQAISKYGLRQFVIKLFKAYKNSVRIGFYDREPVTLERGVLVNAEGDPVLGFRPKDMEGSVAGFITGEPFAEVIGITIDYTDVVDPLAAFSERELPQHQKTIDCLREARIC